MSLIGRISERLPEHTGEFAAIGAAVALLAAFAPEVLMVGVGTLMVAGICLSASAKRKGNKGNLPDPWNNPVHRTAAYFALSQNPPHDRSSSQFQDMVAQDSSERGWER
jgi:hypothetical protein